VVTAGTAPEARLLVVEDDVNIVELLAASLRYAGFIVRSPTVRGADDVYAPVVSCIVLPGGIGSAVRDGRVGLVPVLHPDGSRGPVPRDPVGGGAHGLTVRP
jgi:hypothetical protein